MDKSIIVKGKENDVVFRLFQKDIFIDEIHIKIEGETSWTVIGFKDLQNAIAKAEKKFNPKRIMKFQKKKVTEQVRGILSKYLDGTEKEFKEATEIIVNLIKSEHIAKEHFRKQRDNALIAADKLN